MIRTSFLFRCNQKKEKGESLHPRAAFCWIQHWRFGSPLLKFQDSHDPLGKQEFKWQAKIQHNVCQTGEYGRDEYNACTTPVQLDLWMTGATKEYYHGRKRPNSDTCNRDQQQCTENQKLNDVQQCHPPYPQRLSQHIAAAGIW